MVYNRRDMLSACRVKTAYVRPPKDKKRFHAEVAGKRRKGNNFM